MRIYRVEHKTKEKGPYTCRVAGEILPWKWHAGSAGNHPAPWNDSADRSVSLLPNHEWVCGFKTMELLYEWFYNAAVVEKLIAEDFVIRVFEAPNDSIRAGKRQYTFRRKHAEMVEEFALDIVHCSDHITNPYLGEKF